MFLPAFTVILTPDKDNYKMYDFNNSEYYFFGFTQVNNDHSQTQVDAIKCSEFIQNNAEMNDKTKN